MRRKKYLLGFALSLLQTGACLGASFEVLSGTTVTTTQTLSDVGDTGIIQEGGAISTGSTAVYALNDNQLVINRGSITTTGLSAEAIFGENGNNLKVINYGTIETSGEFSSAIYAYECNNHMIMNAGTIQTSGDSARGMFPSASSNAFITNSGNIFTTGGLGSYGMDLWGLLTSVAHNSGTVHTTGDDVYGVRVFESPGLVFTNTGTIKTEGSLAQGVLASASPDFTLNNCGTIITSNPDSIAILSFDDNFTLNNSGKISSEGGVAIWVDGNNPAFSLSNGSIIAGQVDVTSALNLTVEKGMNLVLTLTDDSAGFGTLNIDGFYLQQGNTVAVYNNRNFAVQPDIVADVSDTFLDGIENPECSSCGKCRCQCRSFWTQGIGSTRYWGGDLDNYKYRQGGFLTGYDLLLKQAYTLRFFGGTLYGQTDNKGIDSNTQLRSASYVGGMALERACDTGCFSCSMTGGYLRFKQTRWIADNLADNGLVGAKNNRGGFFLCPEMSFKRDFTNRICSPCLKGTLRYAGAFLDSYHEREEASPELFLKSRSISMLTGRLMLGLPFKSSALKSNLQAEPYIGAASRFQLTGVNERGAAFDQSIIIPTALKRKVFSVLYGIKSCYSWCGKEFYVDLEGSYEGKRGNRFIGSGGIAYSF